MKYSDESFEGSIPRLPLAADLYTPGTLSEEQAAAFDELYIDPQMRSPARLARALGCSEHGCRYPDFRTMTTYQARALIVMHVDEVVLHSDADMESLLSPR